MQLKTSANAIAYSEDDLNFTLTMWAKLPPTKKDLINAGATIISYDRTFADSNVKPNTYIKDVLFNLVTSSGYTHKDTTTNTPYDGHIRKVHATWAKRLFVVRYNYGSKYGYDYVRIGTIAQDRSTNNLYLFACDGKPYKQLKTRKHVTPKFIAEQLGGNVECYRIDCIQCDQIKQTSKRGKTRDRRHVPDMPSGLSGYDIREGATKHQQTYCDDDHDMLEMPPAIDQTPAYYDQLKESIIFDPNNFETLDQQIAFMLNAIENKYNARYQKSKERQTT